MKQLLNYQNLKIKQKHKSPPSSVILVTTLIKNYRLIFNCALTIVWASINSVSASPVCYMIDANGNKINLSSLCGSKQSFPTSPTSVNSQTENHSNGSVTSPDNSEEKEYVEGEDQLDNQDDKSADPAVNNDSKSQQEEVDPADLPVIQKTIPLIKRQRSPETAIP